MRSVFFVLLSDHMYVFYLLQTLKLILPILYVYIIVLYHRCIDVLLFVIDVTLVEPDKLLIYYYTESSLEAESLIRVHKSMIEIIYNIINLEYFSNVKKN